jgi:predicted enzyme related to lactoylglutathione lyase
VARPDDDRRAKAQQFYAALFDWQIDARDMQGCIYRMIHCGPGPIGGIVEEKNIPVSHWMPYVAVTTSMPRQRVAASSAARCACRRPTSR